MERKIESQQTDTRKPSITLGLLMSAVYQIAGKII